MSYHLKTKHGNTEAIIDDNCGISKFYAIASTLTSDLNVNFANQIDNVETLDWNFQYKEAALTLHYNVFNGVSIFPQKTIDVQYENKAVVEIAYFLEKKVY
jgi:hypothetical protein